MDREQINNHSQQIGEEKPKFKRVFFKESAIAGVSYHLKEDDELWYELGMGVKVALVRERKNKYDTNAVAVALADDFDGDHDGFDFNAIIGYIPRDCNTEIAAMMDAGYADKFEAEITAFRPYGSVNSRIRITVWLLSREPVVERPKLLRIEPLEYDEMCVMVKELHARGTVHFHWGGYPMWAQNLPEVGDEVVFAMPLCGEVLMYLMRIITIGEDAAQYLEDPEEALTDDNRQTYILTNIAGPIKIPTHNLFLLGDNPLDNRSIYECLQHDESKILEQLIHDKTDIWLTHNNLDIFPGVRPAGD